MRDNILTFRFSSTGRVQLNEHGLYCSTSVAQSFRSERDELLRIVSGLREQLETERANDEVREAETEWEIELLRTQIKTQAADRAVLAGAVDVGAKCDNCTRKRTPHKGCEGCPDDGSFEGFTPSPAVALAIKYREG